LAWPEPIRPGAGLTEYEALKRFLLAHRGHFALGLVRVNSPLQRDGIIASLRDDLCTEGLELKTRDYFHRQLPSLYEELRRDGEVIQALKSPQTIALAVIGLEGSIELSPRPGTTVPLFLATLNLQRDNLCLGFPVPITMWLSDYAMDRLAKGAPDFFDFYGALFTFRSALVPEIKSEMKAYLAGGSQVALDSVPVQEMKSEVKAPADAKVSEPPSTGKVSRLDLLHDRLHEFQRRREQLSPVEKRRLAEILEQLGEEYLSLRDKGAAVPYFREAKQLYHELGDRSKEADFLSRLGQAYDRSYQWPEAVLCYEQALPIYKEIGARLGEANTIKALGDVHGMLDQYEQARQRYELALAISREIKDRYTAAWTLYSLGRAHAAQGQENRSESAFQEALRLFEEIGLDRGVEACTRALSELHAAVPAVAESRREYGAPEEEKPSEKKE